MYHLLLVRGNIINLAAHKRSAITMKGLTMAKRYHNSSSMISENRSEPCNLPKEVIDKAYPSMSDFSAAPIGSLYQGVEESMRMDRESISRATNPKKW